jgi:tetratricopeptide (TPR) repeat protein
MINMLKNKINFGKDQYSLKIDFAWKDTLTDEKFVSNSIHFEYFSAMFNLGIVYFEMGKAFYFSEEDLKLKDGVKYFQTAAWIFDRIKEEYQLYVQALNIQPDLQMSYMSFVINFFLISFYFLFLSPVYIILFLIF